jgi:predicted ABC-type ATPase
MARPALFVLAGVNGAGKSSIGGFLLRQAGVTWFNPDAFARELVASTGCDQQDANVEAWHEGLRRLDDAIAHGRDHAFETTLGGRTMTDRIASAAATHDVLVWFCGLSSPDLHIRRVRARVAAGGHDIPDARIRERYPKAAGNLIGLLPAIAHLRVYDNSAEAALRTPVPDPILVLEMRDGVVTFPGADDAEALGRTPEWARPIVEAALRRGGR